MRPNHSRSLGCLSLIELDALLVSYLIYMWEGGSRQLTQTTLMCHARCLDRHLRVRVPPYAPLVLDVMLWNIIMLYVFVILNNPISVCYIVYLFTLNIQDYYIY